MGNGLLLACSAGTLAMLDASVPELNSPPRASTIDAAKARDVDAIRLDRLHGGGLIHRNLGAWCVFSVRVHSPAILTCRSGSPAEESPLRLLPRALDGPT